MKKDLDYYMSLNYTIELVKIPEELGGGWNACIPRLGKYAIVGYGETQQEALQNLESFKRERLQDYLEEGLEIPEPEKQEDPGAEEEPKEESYGDPDQGC